MVIGAGWIGCEVAASARQMGAGVAMVDVTQTPLERVLGAELGGFYHDVHADPALALPIDVGEEEPEGELVEGQGGAKAVEDRDQ